MIKLMMDQNSFFYRKGFNFFYHSIQDRKNGLESIFYVIMIEIITKTSHLNNRKES